MTPRPTDDPAGSTTPDLEEITGDPVIMDSLPETTVKDKDVADKDQIEKCVEDTVDEDVVEVGDKENTEVKSNSTIVNGDGEVKDLSNNGLEDRVNEVGDEGSVSNPLLVIDKDKEDLVESDDDINILTSSKDKKDSDGAKEAHLKQEAELEAYLESLKPKPKRKSIKDILMSMPGFKDVASLKPKIGGHGERKDVIFLDDESVRKESAKELKRRQEIEALKERFLRHALPPPPKIPAEHVKLKIKKKEEDSQGIEHLVDGEVDYVRNVPHDDEDAMSFLSTPQDSSPKNNTPATQRRRLQEILLGKIRAKKAQEHEERRKVYAMYNDEADGEEDGDEKEEEIEDDENSSDDSEVGEEEEELEYLLTSTKKKRKKSKFVDDEAEDEDEPGGSDDDDADDDDDSTDESEDDVGDDESANKKEFTDKVKDDENSTDVDNSQDSSKKHEIQDTDLDVKDSTSNSKLLGNEESEVPKRGIDDSPLVTIPKATSGFWNGSKRNAKDALWSPLLRVLQSSGLDDEEGKEESASKVPESLATVITHTENKFEDLADLCSGKFVSQVDVAVDDDEFAGFDFGDDYVEDIDKTNEPKTPVATTGSKITAVDGITPKLSEKVSKTRLFKQFEDEAEKTELHETDVTRDDVTNSLQADDADDDDDDNEIISTRVRIKKKKRLHFSDDEDDDNNENETQNGGGLNDDLQSESEDLPEEEEEDIELEVEEQPKLNPFFNKHGRLKRKFVDDEAELSGSEEGSADEDERGLNHYEMEEADNEELDEEMVRKQVERAHLKQILDEDDKAIRYLQNTYLENGDLHTDKQRERKFRWMNMSALDEDAVMGDSDDEIQPDENPEEAEKKREWIEKRKWMSENSHLLETDEDESQSLLSNSRFLKISKNTIKRIESFHSTSTSDSKDAITNVTVNQRRSIFEEIISARTESRKSSNGLTSCSEGMEVETDGQDVNAVNKSLSQPLLGLKPTTELSWSKPTVSSIKKGSFLSRGGMMLAKLAETTKTGDAVSNVKTNSRNFVFSHVTPPNPEKTDGSTSPVKRVPVKKSSNAPTKKPKIDRTFNVLDERSKGSIFKHF